MIRPGSAMKVAGVGVDLLLLERFRCLGRDLDDPFYRKTFTEGERVQAGEHGDPVLMLAFSFAGKEAVFKCLGMDGNRVRLNEIEVLGNQAGASASLRGHLARQAWAKGIGGTHLQLWHEGAFIRALAVAERMPARPDPLAAPETEAESPERLDGHPHATASEHRVGSG